MRVVYAASLLLLLTASCARIRPDAAVSNPSSVAAQPARPKPVTKPAAKPAAPATPRRASSAAFLPPPARKPAPAPSATTAAPKPAINVPPPVSAKPAVKPALDLDALETQLKETKAIGLFTKLTLKNQVDDLLAQFRAHYDRNKPPMKDLRRSYDLLIMKVLSLVQDEDQRLASSIVSSREAIWGLLADPKKFASFQG